MKKHPEQIRHGSWTDPGQRSALSHTPTPGMLGSLVPVEPLQPRGNEGHSPRHGRHLYCGCWQRATVTPLVCSPARLLLPCGIRFIPGPSNLLTWSCETSSHLQITRVWLCQQMPLIWHAGHGFGGYHWWYRQCLPGRARAARTKGWFCSAEIFESWDSSPCPCVHPALP